MFTEINGNLYFNDHTMTIILADAVKQYVQALDDDQLQELLAPINVKIDSKMIADGFQEHNARPGDENSDMQQIYDGLPDALTWAVEREIDQRAAAADAADYQRRVDNLINSIVNPEEYPDDDDWDAIHHEEDL